MARKTYLPGAVDIVNTAHQYLTRWQEKLSVDKTPEQLTALAKLIVCCGEFLAIWIKPPPV